MFEIIYIILSILDSHNISCLEFDSGAVYAGTLGGGLYIIETEDFLVKKMPDSCLPCPYVSSVYKRGDIFLVGTYNGFTALREDGTCLFSYVSADHYERFVTSIERFGDRTVLGTSSGIVVLGNGSVFKRPLTLPVSCMFKAGDSLLIGAMDGIYVMRENFEAEKISVNGSYFSSPVRSLLVDSGWIWAGLEDVYEGYSPGGLYLLGGPDLFFRLDVLTGLRYFGVRALCMVGDSLLVSTYENSTGSGFGALQILYAGKIEDFKSPGIGSSFNRAANDILYISERKEIWIATSRGIEIVKTE